MGFKDALLNFMVGMPGTVVENYGKIGSVSLTGISNSVRLVKYEKEGEIFYVLINVNPFSRFPVSSCNLTLDMAGKLVAAFRGDTTATEGSEEPKTSVSSMIGFPGKVVRDYGKIGDEMSLLQFDNSGEKFYLLLAGGYTFCITSDIAEKLLNIFLGKN